MKHSLITLVVGVIFGLSSCTGPDTTPPKTSAKWDQTTIKVVWMSVEDANNTCKRLGVRPLHGTDVIACAAVGNGFCTIYTKQPRSFVDRAALTTLGHETWHCFGAVHTE